MRLATRTATAAMLASTHDAATEQKGMQRATPRRGLPLLDLQQRFVDLRFGMFVHFNMATFQDREWGDHVWSLEELVGLLEQKANRAAA